MPDSMLAFAPGFSIKNLRYGRAEWKPLAFGDGFALEKRLKRQNIAMFAGAHQDTA